MREVVWQLSSNVVVAQSHYQHLVTPFQRQDAYICAHLLIFTFPHEQVSLKWSYERADNDLVFLSHFVRSGVNVHGRPGRPFRSFRSGRSVPVVQSRSSWSSVLVIRRDSLWSTSVAVSSSSCRWSVHCCRCCPAAAAAAATSSVSIHFRSQHL